MPRLGAIFIFSISSLALRSYHSWHVFPSRSLLAYGYDRRAYPLAAASCKCFYKSVLMRHHQEKKKEETYVLLLKRMSKSYEVLSLLKRKCLPALTLHFRLLNL